MSDEISIVLRMIDKASGVTREVTKELKNLDNEAQGVTSRGLGGLQKMLAVGLVGAVGAATIALGGLGAALGSSISKAATMEQGVADIAAAMQLTAEETTQVKGLIQDLGLDPKLKVTATEAADAIEVLGTAGLDVTEILDGAARSTVLLANSTGADFAQAGKIASDVMAQFNIDAKDMASAVDQVTGVTVASKFGITDYQNALAQAGGVAGAVGVDFDDFNAAIAATAPSFNSGGDAGTSFKTFLQRLVPSTDDAKEALIQLGLSTGDDVVTAFFTADGAMRPMIEIAENLQTAFGGLSEAQKMEAASTIFGTDAMRTALALAEGGGEIIDAMKLKIGDTRAEESAATRMNTFAGAIEIALGVIDTISMSIGDKFLPILRPLVERFTELAQTYGPMVIDFFDVFAGRLDNLISLVGRGVFVFEDGSGILAGFIEVLGVSGETAQLVGKSFYDFKESAQAIINPIVSLITQFFSWKDILAAVGTVIAVAVYPALTALMGIVGPAVAVFAGLVAASALLRNAWEKDWLGIRTTLTTVWEVISGVFSSIAMKVEWLVSLWKVGWAALDATNATLGERLIAIWQLIGGVAQTVWEGIVTTVQALWPKFVAAVTEWGKAAWQWIADAVPMVLTTLGTWLNNIITWLGDNIPIFLKTVLEWGTALYTWIGDAIPKAISNLAAFIKGVREKGEGDGKTSFVGMVGGWVTTLWRWIVDDLIPAVGPAFMDFIGSMLSYGSKLLASLGDLARELGLLLWQWIRDAIGPAGRKIAEWGGMLWGWIKDNAPEWGRKLAQWGAAAWQWIVDATGIALKKLSEWGSLLWNWIKDQAPAWWDRLKIWAGMAWEWIRDIAIPEAVKKLVEWGSALWNWIKEKAPEWWDRLKIWAGMAWEWITDEAIPGAIRAIGEWAAELYQWVVDNWPTWRDTMIKAGQDMIDWLRDGIEIAWLRLTHWFFSDNAFGRFVGDILQMFGLQITPAFGIMERDGKQLVYSLNEGSRYGLDSLRQTGSDMGDAIDQGLRDSMDMHSPSRKMWGHGQDIIAGLRKGVWDGQVYVKQTLEDYSIVWQNIVTGQWIPFFSATGQKMGRSVADGLKSETQWVAEQIKATMERTASEINGYVDYFTNQAVIKAQAAHYKIANATKDAAQALKDLGIDTSKVIGYGPNGELILQGITNLPKSSNGGNGSNGTGTNYVPEVKDITTLGEALGVDKLSAQTGATSIGLLGGITLEAVDLKAAKENTAKAVTDSAKAVQDFIAGFTDFLKNTLGGANGVFSQFNYLENKAYKEGELKEFMASETYQTKNQLKDLYQGIQNSIADILGINASELNVTGADSLRLIDRVKQVLSGTSIDTNMEFIGDLLQNLVNFRSLANFGTGADYYDSALPTDARLTGGNTTNTYNINLMGTNNASADLLNTVQLLNQLGATAIS